MIRPPWLPTVRVKVTVLSRCHSKLSAALLMQTQVSVLLSTIDEWGYDTFALDQATSSHALSVLAFALIKRTDAFKKFRLNESKLAG